ncbi:MAG: bifunctional proline dehydrogenase/L-glutamate gamma-semialdehyde dehydrogenase PutA [Pseudomonadota bacterium]
MTRTLQGYRQSIREALFVDEAAAVGRLADQCGLDEAERKAIVGQAADLVRRLRSSGSPGLMEGFLAEYALSTDEGVALMTLAEALLRVPDVATIDALIEDKIVSADWARHLNQSSSPLINASTWGLMLTGKVLAPDTDPSLVSTLRSVVRRLGEPVVRRAVAEAMKELGRQFVLGRTIEEGMDRGAAMEAKGYTYSYDMLGEAARTDADAKRYHLSYSDAITAIAPRCKAKAVRDNPGISVKLSALHPRYELAQKDRVMNRLVPRAAALAMIAASAGMGFNVDAEEADRLDLSLDVFERMLADPALRGWDGFGFVVQAYSPRALDVIEWLYALAEAYDRRLMVRLVKGAYWDTEIKRGQVLGLEGFPVFTRKANTDIAYLACARRLLSMTDRLYPQFATHNAHTISAVLAMAGNDRDRFEFQRLHGMGEELHETVRQENEVRCRIYAPVGAHEDLLAYLVRRLLENGANSSFVNQILDKSLDPEQVVADPFGQLDTRNGSIANPLISRPCDLFQPERTNAKGWDLTDPVTLEALDRKRTSFASSTWHAGGTGPRRKVTNPARYTETVGTVAEIDPADIPAAIGRAMEAQADWAARGAPARAVLLNKVADLYEAHAAEFFVLAAREAGKTMPDAIAELREAVDFLRYYSAQACRLDAGSKPRGVMACISPWNFPLAIFSGQIAAALAAGNAVLAKPAEQTPLIASRAVALMHEAGIPENCIRLLPGDGAAVGGVLLSDPRVAGVCFTGSTDTAKIIDRQMAKSLDPVAPLIAETGGLNAMIVDSSALPEQVVRDIVISAFQSAGQRCSALRILYVQDTVAEHVLTMLSGALQALRLGDPWELSTDVGPVIDETARADLLAYCRRMETEGRVVARLDAQEGEETGFFVPPVIVRVDGIEDLEREVFGPILHVATFKSSDLDAVIAAINAKGYGLTFGLHTRIDDRVQHVVDRVAVGNIYVNRNQIGAIVGSQPFGGEGLSGTGPKAGGPFYVERFTRTEPSDLPADRRAGGGLSPIDKASLQHALSAVEPSSRRMARQILQRVEQIARDSGLTLPTALSRLTDIRSDGMALPGPTGESNRLWLHPTGRVVVVGDSSEWVATKALAALALGNGVVAVLPPDPAADGLKSILESTELPIRAVCGDAAPETIAALDGIDAVVACLEPSVLRQLRVGFADRDGPIVALVVPGDPPVRLMRERHVCVDTTAAGGNASLMAAAEA